MYINITRKEDKLDRCSNFMDLIDLLKEVKQK